jgi:GDPmannose 4,6-dehydratase
VTGFTGQDGSFLTELLLDKGYKVIGLVRRVSTEPPIRQRGRFDFSEALKDGRLVLEQGDLISTDSLIRIIKQHQPDEIYNLAAQSDVHISFMQPEFSVQSTFLGVVNLITALEAVGGDHWKMYQASTSEMFGDQTEAMDENTTLLPNSPYSISKTAAHYYCALKRKQGRQISCGILFNHESEIRGGNFVTQKIARAVIDFEQNASIVKLGNLDSVRDWGYAGDYVKAMWLMLQQDEPTDYVIGTGETHTIREFVEAAAAARQFEVVWSGEGKNTVGHINGKVFCVVSDEYWRPVDVRYLHANNTKAVEKLGWRPEVSFDRLVEIMVDAAFRNSLHGR